MKHKHWVFYACDEIMPDGVTYKEAVQATVNDAENEDEALSEIKKIVKRKNYILFKVYECTQCASIDRSSRAAAEMAKSMREHE